MDPVQEVSPGGSLRRLFSDTEGWGGPSRATQVGTRCALLRLLLSVPWGCWNGGPQTPGLETTQIHLLDSGGQTLKSGCGQSRTLRRLQEGALLPLSAPVALGGP